MKNKIVFEIHNISRITNLNDFISYWLIDYYNNILKLKIFEK